MKKISQLCLLFSSMLLFSTPAFAHPDFLGRMTERLGLSEEQVETIEGILDAARENCDSSESFEERHACMEEQREEVKSQVDAVLTEEQLAQLEEGREDREGCQKVKQRLRKFRKERSEARERE